MPKKNLIVVLGGIAVTILLLFLYPEYFANYSILGAAIVAEIIIIAVSHYKQAFFPLLVTTFLCAGIMWPYRGSFLYARWPILATGAVAGFAVYMRDRNHHFGSFHLVACFCVLSAIVSALVSAYPEEALLKALSLGLLFIYAASGGRTAVILFQPWLFFRNLLIGCEILSLLTVILYFVFRWELFGNPNSLGAVMGVAVVPLMLWGLITAETSARRRRLGAELIIALLLLMSSFARAAIGAAAVSCFLLCIASRQYRLLAKGVAAVVVLAIAAATFVPQPEEAPQWSGSEAITAMFLYKGHEDGGVLGSRRGVWSETWDVIKGNPWFGSGFGTSVTSADMTKMAFAKTHIDSWIIREHGNSYLAIAEWVGLLGVVPFILLLLLAAHNAARVFLWVRSTGDFSSAALPAAAVVAAGLVHAAFEDWMFAVGYYVCVFFWTIAFILIDVMPHASSVHTPETIVALEERFQSAPLASLS